MPKKLLSISIPTFNRWEYLADLLPNLLEQSRKVDPEGRKIEIVISDNASTDETANGILAIREARLRYFRNGSNIGGDANFVECVKRAKAKYVWIFGDDEIIRDGGIERVLDVLEKIAPRLLITTSILPQSSSYHDYRHLLLDVLRTDPLFPVHHTLITTNIFEKTLFDIEKALQKQHTYYGHMYALLDNLRDGRVYCFGKSEKVVLVREARAPFAANLLNLAEKLVAYQSRVASTFGVPYFAFYVRLFYFVLNRKGYKAIKEVVSWPWNFARRAVVAANRIIHGPPARLNLKENTPTDAVDLKNGRV